MAASNIADRHAGLHRLGNNGQLQIGREAPPTGDASDHFDFRERVGHRRIPRLVPKVLRLSSVSGPNGVQFINDVTGLQTWAQAIKQLKSQ